MGARHSMAADVVVIWTTHQTGRIHSLRILIRGLCLHLQAVCHQCPLDGFLLSQGLVTIPEGPLGLPVAECPITTPRTRLLVNIKANRDTSKGTKGIKDSKAVKHNKDIMVATRIGVEAEEAMVVIVEAGSEARTAITMAVTAVEEVEEVTVATRGDKGVTTLSSSL